MAIRKARTARQIAASRRNIVAAQKRSAALRRGGAGKNGNTAFYGKGRSGRKAAKRSTYGRKKDGLSIAQQQRRRQRSNKRKRVVSTAISAGSVAVAAHHIYKTNPDVKRSVNVAKKRAKSEARNVKQSYDIGRAFGQSKPRSAKFAAKSVRRDAKRRKAGR